VKAVERKHLGKLAAFGCIVCYNNGYPYTPAEIHHLRSGAGAGQRSSHYRAIPLCHTHHRTGGFGMALHAGQKTWESNFGTEEDLLAKVMTLI